MQCLNCFHLSKECCWLHFGIQNRIDRECSANLMFSSVIHNLVVLCCFPFRHRVLTMIRFLGLCVLAVGYLAAQAHAYNTGKHLSSKMVKYVFSKYTLGFLDAIVYRQIKQKRLNGPLSDHDHVRSGNCAAPVGGGQAWSL